MESNDSNVKIVGYSLPITAKSRHLITVLSGSKNG